MKRISLTDSFADIDQINYEIDLDDNFDSSRITITSSEYDVEYDVDKKIRLYMPEQSALILAEKIINLAKKRDLILESK